MSRTPCIPDTLPIPNLDWRRLAPFTSKAMQAVARYDGTLDGMINAAVLLSPITNQEAVLSSRIEGTQASLTEVLKHEAGERYSEGKRGDIQEIMNYRKALLTAESILKERPITLSLIRELHAMLMNQVRGGDKTPGTFRTDQNWIGPKGCTIKEARFVPPSPLMMHDALENLEAYMASDDSDPLVHLAITHAQFEIIHPFNDGNGRLGRMLIPLLLYQKQVLQRPMFYLSDYLEASDQEYRARLLAITDQGDWQGWVEFFLKAIQKQAEGNINKAKQIHALYEELKENFRKVTHSQFAVAALDAFFTRPILNTGTFIQLSGMTNRGSANALLRTLTEQGLIQILRQGSGRRSAAYTLPRLITIAEGREVF
ncbi:MAG: Fic family protein [Magnetococcales bacterium]|nr:Fic family protein [Magnetococcales bacterium]